MHENIYFVCDGAILRGELSQRNEIIGEWELKPSHTRGEAKKSIFQNFLGRSSNIMMKNDPIFDNVLQLRKKSFMSIP